MEESSVSKELEIPEPTTETELREWAFAKRVLEVIDVAEAYRDVFDPGADVTPRHHVGGARMMERADVGKLIRYMAPPALVKAGVEREHALRRLLQTIDSDITDYVDMTPVVDEETGAQVGVVGGFMSLEDIRQKLPAEKRRLIKKFTEVLDKKGNVRRRVIELEPKHQALELLARIQQLVQPNTLNVTNSETIVNVITLAQGSALKRAAEIRAALGGTNTIQQLSRSAGAQEALALTHERKP